jgi:hypothetical protein
MNLFASLFLVLMMYIIVFGVSFLTVGAYSLLPSSFRKKLENFLDNL